MRVSINSGAGSASMLQLQQGPQFWNHGETTFPTQPDPRTVDAVIQDSDTVRTYVGADGVTVTLHREGLMLRGTLADSGTPVPLTCWCQSELFGSSWGNVHPGTIPAHFNWDTQKCAAADGTETLNSFPIEFVRETSFGECADLRGVRLNDNDASGPVLQGWDLIGANLDGAQLHFASLTSAALNSADLSGLQYGYALVSGSIDSATQLPAGDCQTTSSPWGGDSVTCEQ